MLFNVTGLTVEVSIFTLISMWAAAMYIYVQHTYFEGGGETAMKGGKIPPLGPM